MYNHKVSTLAFFETIINFHFPCKNVHPPWFLQLWKNKRQSHARHKHRLCDTYLQWCSVWKLVMSTKVRLINPRSWDHVCMATSMPHMATSLVAIEYIYLHHSVNKKLFSQTSEVAMVVCLFIYCMFLSPYRQMFLHICTLDCKLQIIFKLFS